MDVTTDEQPFPSKEFALLYFIQNSPHPMASEYSIHLHNSYGLYYYLVHMQVHMQGGSNVKLMWHIMHQLKSDIPSISNIKKFTLPCFHSPEKVQLCIIIHHDSYSTLLLRNTKWVMRYSICLLANAWLNFAAPPPPIIKWNVPRLTVEAGLVVPGPTLSVGWRVCAFLSFIKAKVLQF